MSGSVLMPGGLGWWHLPPKEMGSATSNATPTEYGLEIKNACFLKSALLYYVSFEFLFLFFLLPNVFTAFAVGSHNGRVFDFVNITMQNV